MHQEVIERELTRDRAEIDCERCGYWPCVCGDTNFEADNNMALRQAEEIE